MVALGRRTSRDRKPRLWGANGDPLGSQEEVMSNPTIHAELRTNSGKGVARSLRRGGRMPAVAYGGGTEALPLSIDPKLSSAQSTKLHEAYLFNGEVE